MSLTRIIARQTMQQRRTFVNGWANKPDGGKIRATQQIFQDPAKAHLHGVDGKLTINNIFYTHLYCLYYCAKY
tara:strand:+ start:24 stop:242 length:219 start_codon:yes stop_codon:yes gene_type:complete